MYRIYKITSTSSPLVYVGSCKGRYLSQRMAEHRYSFRKGRKCESKRIFATEGTVTMEIVEVVDCEKGDKFAVRCREQYHIAQAGSDAVNKARAIPKKFPKSQKITLRDPVNFIRFLFK